MPTDRIRSPSYSSPRYFAAPALLVALMAMTVPAQAQENSLPAVALERLEYAIGEWDYEGVRIAPDGSTGEVTKGGQVATWLVPGKIVQMADRDPGGGGRSWWVYDVPAEAWTLVSISVENGALWIMKGNLEEWVITSDLRELPNGRSAMIRFTHYDIEPDSYSALQEVSRDGGETWTPVYRQTLTRRR